MANRQTMGQDQAGSRKINPDNAPDITKQQVLDLADELSIEVRRGNYFADGDFYHSDHGTWWKLVVDHWISIGETNYGAYKHLSLCSGKNWRLP